MQLFTQQEIQAYTFYDLVKDLIPNLDNPKERMIKGCQIFMPETVFFKDGQLDYCTILDKDQCLAYEIKTRNVRSEVIKWFKSVIKERWNDFDVFGKETAIMLKQLKQKEKEERQ